MSDEKPATKVGAAKVKWLQGELPGWVGEGLISQEAADTLAKRYQLAREEGGRSMLVYAVGTLAALLLGIGVILYFSANWDDIPRYGKLAIICIAVAGSYLAGYVLKYQRDYDAIGGALILLGTILFGAGIFLVAQAFHLKPHFPNGVLLWMLGIIPLVVLIKSKPILAEAIILFAIWIGWELVAVDHGQYGPLLLRSFLGLGIFGGLIYMTYSFGHKANAALAVPAAVTWLTVFMIAVLKGDDDGNVGHILQMYFTMFIALGALGVLHRLNEKWPPFAGVYQTMSLLVISVVLYMLTFPDLVEEIQRGETFALPVIIAFLSMAAILAISVNVFRESENSADKSDRDELYIYLGLCAFSVLLYLFFLGNKGDMLIAVSANIALFALIVSLIMVGSRSGQSRLINFGIALFAIDIVTRYFDMFWDLRDRAIFFIVSGLILLVSGIALEKQRRKWILKAREVSK